MCHFKVLKSRQGGGGMAVLKSEGNHIHDYITATTPNQVHVRPNQGAPGASQTQLALFPGAAANKRTRRGVQGSGSREMFITRADKHNERGDSKRASHTTRAALTETMDEFNYNGAVPRPRLRFIRASARENNTDRGLTGEKQRRVTQLPYFCSCNGDCRGGNGGGGISGGGSSSNSSSSSSSSSGWRRK